MKISDFSITDVTQEQLEGKSVKITDIYRNISGQSTDIFEFLESTESKRKSSNEEINNLEKALGRIIDETDIRKLTDFNPVFITPWRTKKNIHARLIEFSDQEVTLECLIDRENMVYEEKTFDINLFSDYELLIGALFNLRYLERKNEIRMQVLNDPMLTNANLFPKTNFKSLFDRSILFKK